MKKLSKKSQNSTRLKYLTPVFIVSLLVFGAVIYQNQKSPNVLGESTLAQNVLSEESEDSKDAEEQEETEKTEPTEEPEPTEAPEPEEPTEADEQEAEDIQGEIENEVKQGKIEEIEVEPTSDKQGEGMIKVERVNGTTSEKSVPVSNTPLVQLQDAQAGAVAISVGKGGTVTLINNGITIKTNHPVIIDPQAQTIAVRTTNGVTIINTFPSQALNSIKPADKPTTIQTAALNTKDGQIYYEVAGAQDRKFAGLIPVTANVGTKIDAQNGSIITVNRPWYLNLLGFLYAI